jgi:hypothetical protein
VRDASYMNMLYFLVFNLPDAWQVGMNPAITHDRQSHVGTLDMAGGQGGITVDTKRDWKPVFACEP